MNLFIESSFGTATGCLTFDQYVQHFELVSPYEKHIHASWQSTLNQQLNIAREEIQKCYQHQTDKPAALLQKVYVGIGPGKFTSIRYAVGFAYGLAWAIKADLYGIPSQIAQISNNFAAENSAGSQYNIQYISAGNQQSIMYSCDLKHKDIAPISNQQSADSHSETPAESMLNKLQVDADKTLPSAKHLVTATAWHYKSKPLATLLYDGAANQHIHSLSTVMSYGTSKHWVSLADQNSAFE